VPGRAPAVDQGVGVVERPALQVGCAQEGVQHGLLVQVRVLGVAVGQVHLVLEEDQAAGRAGLAVGLVAQGVVRAEALRGLAAADPAGHVVLPVDHVVPQGHDRALVVEIVRLCGHVGHARVVVDRADRMAHGLILLLHRDVALVVLAAVPAAVQEELGQLDVAVAVAARPLHVVHEPPEPHQGLLHLLVAVVPVLLARSQVGGPAVGQFLGRIVQPLVRAVGQGVVVDGGLDEVAGHIALVVPPVPGIPPLGPAGPVGQGIGGLEIPVRLLGGQDLGDPVLQGGLHPRLGLEDLGVALGVDHEGDAHGLHGLVHPGVGEHIALVAAVGLAPQGLGRLNEVVDPARALAEVGVVDLVDAVGDPVDDQGLGPRVPERAVDLVVLRIHHVQAVRRRGLLCPDLERGRRAEGTLARGQLEDIVTRCGEDRCGRGRSGVRKGHVAGPGLLGPDHLARGRVALEALDLSREEGLSAHHDHAVPACRHGRRELGGLARVIDPPLQDARGVLLVAVDLQAELGRGHLVEGRGVELAGPDPKAGGVGHGHKGLPVPVQKATRLGYADPLLVVPPVHVDLVCADRPAPIVLDPLGACAGPVSVRPAPRAAGTPGCNPVMQGGQCRVPGYKRTRGDRNHGQIDPWTGLGGRVALAQGRARKGSDRGDGDHEGPG